jgi:hypothetical protein
MKLVERPKPTCWPNRKINWNITLQCGNIIKKFYWIQRNRFQSLQWHRGSFDRTSFHVITQAAERHGTESTSCRWICSKLESRDVSTLSGTNLEGVQGWVMSAEGCAFTSTVKPGCGLTLWELNDNNYYKIWYAYDIAILINGKFLSDCVRVFKNSSRHSSTVVW